MNPLASIIIPVYNVEPYLKECLDSVLNQSYKNLEILIVDDGSTDKSGEICDSYCRDPRVTVFHQSNGGLSVARNTALDKANGEYIFFVDSDDFVHPDMVSKAVASLEDNDADIVIFGRIEIHDNEYEEVIPTKSLGLSTTEIKKRIISDDIENFAWNKASRRKLWNIRRFPPGINFEDLATTPYIFNSATKIVSLNDSLYFYRIRSSSYMNSPKFSPSRDYLKIQVFKSLEPLAKSNKDSQVLTRLHARILNDSIKLAILNYYLNELAPDEAHTLEKYIKRNWDESVLQQLGHRVLLYRWMILHTPCLAHLYGTIRYRRKCRERI